MKNNIVILLDFDRTLFDTNNFLLKIKKIFKEIGIDENKFVASYKKTKPYSIKKHTDLLKLPFKDKGLVLKNFNTLINNSKRFLFPDTIKFLKFLNENNIKSILVTYGDKEFQSDKIEHSNIKSLLNKILITSENQDKENIYKKIVYKNKNKEIIIIDDLKENTKNVIKNIPKIKAIKINRNKNNTKIDSSKKYYEVKDLTQAKKIISQL